MLRMLSPPQVLGPSDLDTFFFIFPSAYTSAGPFSLKQNGATSGHTDSHPAHSTNIGSGAGYCSFLLIHELQLVRAVQLRKRTCLLQAVAGREEIYLRPSDPFFL